MNLQRGPRPGAIKNGVARFAGKAFRSDFGFSISLFVKGKTLPGFEFVFARSLHAPVEAGDQHVTFRILQLADDFNQRKERIRRRAPIHTRMQIHLGSVRFDFRIDQSTQADAQSRKIRSEQFRIADQREISLQLGLLLFHIFCDGFAANFFFAFKNNFHINRQLAIAGFHQRLERLHFHPKLALIVDRAARINIVVASVGSNGGVFHSSSGSGGCTS